MCKGGAAKPTVPEPCTRALLCSARCVRSHAEHGACPVGVFEFSSTPRTFCLDPGRCCASSWNGRTEAARGWASAVVRQQARGKADCARGAYLEVGHGVTGRCSGVQTPLRWRGLAGSELPFRCPGRKFRAPAPWPWQQPGAPPRRRRRQQTAGGACGVPPGKTKRSVAWPRTDGRLESRHQGVLPTARARTPDPRRSPGWSRPARAAAERRGRCEWTRSGRRRSPSTVVG